MSDLRQRQPRMVDPGYISWLHTKRCAFCGATPVEAAHIRMASAEVGKRETGGAEKPDDRWAVPLCAWCHRTGADSQHNIGEERFWKIAEINPIRLAQDLYAEYGGTGGAPYKKGSRGRAIPSRKMKGKRGYGQRDYPL